MKTIKFLSMLLAMVAMSIGMTSCGDDDSKEASDPAALLSGDYSGSLRVMGYTDTYKAYVDLERKAPNAVAFVIDCDELDLHSQQVILDIIETAEGYEVSSESKAVTGSVIANNLNLTFDMSDNTFVFIGSKQ